MKTIAALLAAVMLTGNAFSGEIYSCVDREGKKRIQSNPCGSKEKTTDRQVFTESSRQTAPSSVSAPTSPQMAIDATRKQQSAAASEQMLKTLSRAKKLANESSPGNGARILSSALCGLWQSYVLEEQRQALLSQAELLAAGYTPGNRARILSAALGRCPDSASDSASPPRAQVFSPPATPRSAINTQTGEVYPGVPGGVINPRSGQFYPDVGGGYINPATGQFMPKQ
jgi:hypothetical protein